MPAETSSDAQKKCGGGCGGAVSVRKGVPSTYLVGHNPKRHPRFAHPLLNEDWLTDQRVRLGRSIASIASELGTSTSVIDNRLSEWGIKTQRFVHPLLTPEYLREQHVIARRAPGDIATELGTGAKVIVARLREWGIPVLGYARRIHPLLGDEQWLRREYLDRCRSARAIAAELGTRPQTVGHALARLGIDRRSGAGSHSLRLRTKVPSEAAELYERGCSLVELGVRYGVHGETVRRTLVERGVAMRSRGESNELRRLRSIRWAPSSAKRAAMAREACECVVCGEKSGLEMHHLDGDRANGDEWNLVPLCGAHHTMVEWFIRPVAKRYERVLRAAEAGCTS